MGTVGTIQKNPSIMDRFSEDQRILHVVNLCERGDLLVKEEYRQLKDKS